MASEDADTPPFYTRYGFSRSDDRERPLVVEPYAEICRDGVLLATVIASAVDLVGGFFTREIAGADATFTSDLSLRIPRPGRPDRLVARGELLRSGRRLTTTGVTLVVADAGGPSAHSERGDYAYGQTTFTRIPRRGSETPDPASLATPRVLAHHPLTEPLEQAVGIELVDARAGRVQLPFRPALLNPEGVLQGALVALVVEVAAQALATTAGLSRPAVCELDLRYLAAAARGPVESRARWLGPASARMIAIELRDLGRDARRTTTAFVRVIEADREPEAHG